MIVPYTLPLDEGGKGEGDPEKPLDFPGGMVIV